MAGRGSRTNCDFAGGWRPVTEPFANILDFTGASPHHSDRRPPPSS
jgi:hypothetical protein